MISEQFLNQTFKKIIETCLQDEAVDTLKILENKDYFLQRVSELYADIYAEERENKILELTNLVNTFQHQQKQVTSLEKGQFCQSCQSLHSQLFALEKEKRDLVRKMSQLNDFEEKEGLKLDSFLLQENHTLKIDLKNVQDELHEKSKEWQEEKDKLMTLNEYNRQQIKGNSQEKLGAIEHLKMSLTSSLEQKHKLEKQVHYYLEQRGQEQKQLREASSKTANLNLEKEKLSTELNLLKNESSILQEKIRRLEQENQFIKQNVISLEKENKQLKKKNSQILHELNKDPKQECQTDQRSTDLVTKYTKAQQFNFQLQKQISDLKQELTSINNKYNYENLEQEKTIIKLNEELRQIQVKQDRELRTLKDHHKTYLNQQNQKQQDDYERQMTLTTKKFENIVNQKAKNIEKLTCRNQELKKKLQQTQEKLRDISLEYQEEKMELITILQKQKGINREMKRHYEEGKVSVNMVEKDYGDKLQQFRKQQEALSKIIDFKDKDIKKLNKEIAQLSDELTNKALITSSLQQKLQESKKTIQNYQSSSKEYRDTVKQREKSLKDISKKYENLQLEKQQLKSKVQSLLKKEKNIDQKVRKIEKELNEKRQMILSLQEENKNEVLNIFEKSQMTTVESKKQLQSYYKSLLKNHDQKITYEEKRSIEKGKEEEINQLEEKAEELEGKLRQIKSRYSSEIIEKQTLQEKMFNLFQEMDKLKTQNRDLVDQLGVQKKNNLHMIRSYQQKMIEYYNQFGEFKKELYLSLRDELAHLKSDLRTITMMVNGEIQKIKQYLSCFSLKMIVELNKVSTEHQLSIDRLHHQYKFGEIQQIEDEKRQLQITFELKIKEQSMEFYTILAEKDHLANCLQTKTEKLLSTITDLENKNCQVDKIARQGVKKQEQFKEIINKMNTKVNQAERVACSSKSELDHLKRQNTELKKEMMSLEHNFKEKIQKCRQTYTSENERLFAKYEKEFSKFIVSNRKGLQFSMLNHSKSGNTLIPTKGCNNDDKLEKIQRQIEEQKKKLNLLQHGTEERYKLDKTKKTFQPQRLAKSRK